MSRRSYKLPCQWRKDVRRTAELVSADEHSAMRLLGMASLRFLHLGISVWALTTLACGSEDLVLPADVGPSRIEVVRGNGQDGMAGWPLREVVVVRVLDEAGTGVAGTEVDWVVSGGGGTVTPATAITDPDGFASAVWTLGPLAGANTLNAVAGSTVVTFTAMAGSADGSGDGPGGDDGGGDDGGSGGDGGGVDEPGVGAPSASHSTVSADPSSIEASTGMSTIRVTVRDDAGAPVPGAIVTISVSGTGNTLTQPAAPTGTDGVATGTLRSTVPGTKDITVTVNGSVLLNQTVQVAVVAGPPAAEPDHFVFRVQPRNVEENEQFTVEVALVDATGEIVPLSGIEIYLGLFAEGNDYPSNRLLAGHRFRDTENGVATFTLRILREGRYRFRALSDELPALGPHGPEPYLFSNAFEVD